MSNIVVNITGSGNTAPSPSRPTTVYMRSHATQLTPEDYVDIHAMRGVKGGAALASKRYNIGTTRVYNIWRGDEV